MSAANRGAASDPRDYYPTPEWVAELYARWLASVTEVRSVCDPFAGDGAILRAFRRVLGPGVRLVAMERDPSLAAQITVADEVIVGDTFGSDMSFDFIVTNPPYTTAREANDEKHICPLQLGTIERCIKLYSNPGEVVLTPFLGIGSEAYTALKFGRKAIGIELKETYYNVAVRNLQGIEAKNSLPTLFDLPEMEMAQAAD
jgi:hypothetical protein